MESKIEMDIFEFLYHGGSVKAEDVPPEIWVEVLNYFIADLGPYLKYIDGLKTMGQIITDGEWLNNSPGSPAKTFRIKEANFIAENSLYLGTGTRGFFIAKLVGRKNGIPKENPMQPIRYINLVLTEKGEWVEWWMEMLEDICCSSMTQIKNDSDFKRLLEKSEISGRSIMGRIYLLLHNCVSAKEDRLKNLKRLRDLAGEINGRLRS
jgi:hypothetical protein